MRLVYTWNDVVTAYLCIQHSDSCDCPFKHWSLLQEKPVLIYVTTLCKLLIFLFVAN
jgi:hypothetical protein